MELVTKPGTITYSNSEDTSKRSSTLDLTFVSERIRHTVALCEPIEPPGFTSDHRIIETLIGLRLDREHKTRRCWDKVTAKRFQQHLVPHLPPGDYPVETEDDIDHYFTKIGKALTRTMISCVPQETCRRSNKFLPCISSSPSPARLEDLQKTSQMTEHQDPVPPEEEIRRRIQKLEGKSWHLFTERRSDTLRKAYGLAKLARKLKQPQEGCHVPPLLHDGKYIHDDKGKTDAFVKVIFRANDDNNLTTLIPSS
ncbi:hypothetical protein NW757_009728 [Fusarium falciforme]|nr:hypothetical protein NW757_009728 [Fusarium falciforme]